MLKRLLVGSGLFALVTIIALACGGGDGPSCGGARCASGQQCCNQCGSSVCADKCVAIQCASDSGPACGATTCAPNEVCCTGCNGEKSCGVGCPAIMCPADSGADGDAAGDGSSDSSSDAPVD